MWPLNRGRKKIEDEATKLLESLAYDEIARDEKFSDIIMVYDEADILLFQRPKRKRKSIK